jgi:hypothetical protein
MSLYEVNISLYVPEALRAGRQARQQEQVGQRARRQAGRAPVIGFLPSQSCRIPVQAAI